MDRLSGPRRREERPRHRASRRQRRPVSRGDVGHQQSAADDRSTVAWSPDGRQIAFVSSVPGPETADATGDPIVITRYLYKPDAAEGMTRFNDNRRLHIFRVDVGTGAVTQLTDGTHYEHSIDWSPKGDEIAFISNREPNEDQFFNYDLFTLRLSDNSIRRLTSTENAEYRPRWSPDGKTIAYQATKRGLTDLETTMEDTHVWLIDADGSHPARAWQRHRQPSGRAGVDADGRAILFTVQERGATHLYRLPIAAGKPELVVGDRGTVGEFSIREDGPRLRAHDAVRSCAALHRRPEDDRSQRVVLGGKRLAEVESLTFVSNDNKFEVEAFLTIPPGVSERSKAPLIVNIHGGRTASRGRRSISRIRCTRRADGPH
jgi:dipeptidyl aminopeptidase/acylaminoacyl peptidase